MLGYYNVTENSNDIFEYANYKLKKECLNRKFIYIDLSKQLSKNPMYFSKKELLFQILKVMKKFHK